jgi:hypothetical protein
MRSSRLITPHKSAYRKRSPLIPENGDIGTSILEFDAVSKRTFILATSTFIYNGFAQTPHLLSFSLALFLGPVARIYLKLRSLMRVQHIGKLAFAIVLASSAIAQTSQNASSATAAKAGDTSVLTAAEATKILPAAVFFRGQSAPVQGRNSAGVRLPDHSLVLISLVDTSGYSSQVQQKYQAYLITESTLDIDGHTLPPGAYGCGFIANDSFVVMDIGGHDLFTAHSSSDSNLHRPRPLVVTPSPDNGSYRLYAGRSYITFRAASGN